MNQQTGRLGGRVAIISGGARGQGAAEAALFVAQGASVVLGDVLDETGQATAASLGSAAVYHHLDVTSEASWTDLVAATLDRFGQIDVLVNNAGIFRLASLTDTTPQLWHQVMDVNATGVYLGMRTVCPTMIEQRRGSIINISSVAGLRGAGMAFAYGASKWAVRGMTKSAAQTLAPFGVRCNSVHPGIIDTAMLQEFDRAGVRESVRERIPMAREASPDEVAALVLYLASDESSYSTGSEFIVDGGMTM
jgi:3alpha(or 20beta)-hydroxysteroid dehydrogenase